MGNNRANDLFEKIKKDGVKAIDELILTRKSEELFLDFKKSSDNGSGRILSDDDRKNLGKAISGFGNSAGGLIIWGLECAPDKNGADVVNKKALLQDAKKYVSQLEGAISGVTLPPHAGVENLAIALNGKREGFVATYVPENSGLPLQSVSKSQFYIRAGSNFIPTPYNVLASLFGKRPQPYVFVNYTLSPAKVVRDGLYLQAGFMVHNRGPGIATDLYLNSTIRSSAGDQCVLAFATPDTNNWTGSFSFGAIINLIGVPTFRLSPEGMSQPLILQATIKPPFTMELEISVMCGSGGSVPMKSVLGNTKEEIQKIYDSCTKLDAQNVQYLEIPKGKEHDVAAAILRPKGPKLG